ncbi:hypothetical protein ABBQ38_007521 [Trebouxia sp. C0009 RCD-2024]
MNGKAVWLGFREWLKLKQVQHQYHSSTVFGSCANKSQPDHVTSFNAKQNDESMTLDCKMTKSCSVVRK